MNVLLIMAGVNSLVSIQLAVTIVYVTTVLSSMVMGIIVMVSGTNFMKYILYETFKMSMNALLVTMHATISVSIPTDHTTVTATLGIIL